MCGVAEKMKTAAIITVAGTSTRFRKSIGKDCLKCIYSEKNEHDTLLMRQLSMCKTFDEVIIVGGYKFSELETFVYKYLKEYPVNISLVQNEHYEDLGSGYSLILGIQEAEKLGVNQILFLEGDLFFDSNTFKTIVENNNNVVTVNTDPIEAKKAVAFYINERGKINYIYDTAHSALSINEPFLGIYNSGQVWKFSDAAKLYKLTSELTQNEIEGTNLVLVQKYFGSLNQNEYKVIRFNDWINCNTVEDYRKAEEIK